MLSPMEMKRIREIDSRLAEVSSLREKIAQVHAQASRQQRALDSEIARLADEKEAIEQGQLLFHVEQSA